MKRFVKKYLPECLITLICVCILMFLLILSTILNTKLTVISTLAMYLSAILFCVAGIKFVFAWMRDFKTASSEAIVYSPKSYHMAIGEEKESAEEKAIFFGLFAFVIMILAYIASLRILLGFSDTFGNMSGFWFRFDSQHYLSIAKDWYQPFADYGVQVRIVFLPGYPLMVRAFSILTLGNFEAAAFLVSMLSFAGGGTAFYKLVKLDHSKRTAKRALCFLCLMPGAFFFAAPMSESLFFFLTVMTIYFARKRRYIPAALMGCYATFTKSIGIVILVPVVYEYIRDLISKGNKVRKIFGLLSALIIPLGFVCYLYINKTLYGDPFQFVIYEREQWNQQIGLFFNTAEYQMRLLVSYIRSGNIKSALGLWGMGLLSQFGALVILIKGNRKIRTSLIAYGLCYYVIAIGVTWLLSAPRYMLVLTPLPIIIAESLKKRREMYAGMIFCLCISIIYSIMFVLRWQVW